MEKVCEELDRVLLELMSSLEELSVLRKRYGAAVSEGYFNMAKARYAMGAQTVGALQYDTVMSALVHVRTSRAIVSYDEAVSSNGDYVNFEVDRIQPGKVGRSHDASLDDQLGESVSEEVHLRRRKPVAGEEQERRSVEELLPTLVGEDEEEMVEGEPPKDPLRWFGVLVPRSLRHSQQSFIQAVMLCAELASVQLRVEALRRQYCCLMEQKKQLGRQTEEQTSQ